MRLKKPHAQWHTKYARRATHYYHNVRRAPILRQIIFWKAKGTRLINHLHPWVEKHAETMDVVYRATAMRTAHQYATRTLKEWRPKGRCVVQFLWECKRDILKFWATPLNLPRCTKPAKPANENPPLCGKRAQF